jgi:hypothetical protein
MVFAFASDKFGERLLAALSDEPCPLDVVVEIA